ncbi:hypothetical protein EUGRSUZ_C03038 [Eucalyptus grandis]|uniref:Uncharacterized protein n=1 Tax=Eucalyptus grandis TaxID=71139 RepID=A0ACC3LID9_EUCGR|nr:hypothetical protein EUGRSUZ_C03038 [Eucalyptus grandis]
MALLSALATEIVIPVCALVGIAYSYYLVRWFLKSRNSDELDHEEQGLTRVQARCAQIKQELLEGVKAFLFTECRYGGVFMVACAILIFLCLGSVEGFSTQSQPCRLDPSNMCKPALATAVFSAVSFLLGAFTSVLSGFLGMQIAIYANARTALEERKGVGKALFSAFRSGAVMGFLNAANGLLVLYIAINLFKLYYGDDWEGLFEAIAGYGLGASSMALFGRGTGGIYAKAADVCCHLGKRIPSMGILVCLMTTLFTASFSKIKEVKEIKRALRKQLIISTILMTFGIVIVSWIALPSSFTVYNFGSQKDVKNWQLCFCVGVGLWAGLTIGFVTKLYSNDDISLLQDLAADSVGFGLASFDIPIFAAVSILLSYTIASMYGIAVAAVGMLSTIATRLAIDDYSPISDNAKRIAESDGNTAAAIGKGFAIESASLVSMALLGAFMSRAAISPVDVLTPKFLMGSIVGGMLPNSFSAMTMKRVGTAALEMVDMVRQAFQAKIDGRHCARYSRNLPGASSSIKGMIRPAALAMLIPLIVGTFFGVEMLSGVLAGSLGSVVRIAISASNTGGVWEKAKEYIRAGASEYAKTQYHEGSKIRRAADEGDIIGDPLKDPSGPPLNILIQLMAVESLVFARFFTTHGGLLFKIF